MTSGFPNVPSIEASPNIYPEYCHDLSLTLLKWCPLRAADFHALKDVGMFLDDLRLYHYDNHPVKWVKLVGVVVAVDEFFKRKMYTVDDGSGACVECTCVAPEPSPTAISAQSVPSHLDQASRSLVTTSAIGSASRLTSGVRSGEKTEQEYREEEGKEVSEGVQHPKVPWDRVDVGTVVKIKGRVGAFRDIKQVEVVRIEITTGTVNSEIRFWDEALGFKRDVLSIPWDLTLEQQERCKRRRDKRLRSSRRGQTADKGKREETVSVKEKEKDKDRKGGGRRDAARHILEEKREKTHTKESKRKRLETGKEEAEEKSRWTKGKSGERLSEEDEANYPPLAARRAAAGKYAALGI